MRPGMSVRPRRSTTSASGGTRTLDRGPTASIFVPLTTSAPSGTAGAPVQSRIAAPTNAVLEACVDPALFHDHPNVLDAGDVGERIAADGDHIGVLPHLEGPPRVLQT